jgi:flagellar basal body rod protein FlgB
VINENLANSNTADYVATDLSPMSSGRRKSTQLTTTDNRHCSGTRSTDAPYERIPDLQATRLDGHININEQLVKLQETYAESALMMGSFKKFADFYKIVLKR